jgi:hypothetical protein
VVSGNLRSRSASCVKMTNIGIIQASGLFMKNSRQLLRYCPMKNS